MKPERWRQVDDLLQSALEHAPERRAEFLAQACPDDESLRREVESLLEHHQQARSFLEEPPSDIAAGMLEQSSARLADGQRVGHYKTLALLGAGGMGEVYLAHDTSLGRRVALKLLPAQFTEDEDRVHRFEQEARAASALNHPNIVTIHEIGRIEETHFIVTEFIDGQTLRQRLTNAPIPLPEAIDIAIQVAGALDAAHTAGIVHRDIKPENIMLRPDGLVKVLDFGLAKLVTHPESTSHSEAPTRASLRTNLGAVVGTAQYMSPEQARGQDVDVRTDIFSLGVVLYEMVAGRPPFVGATITDVLAAILKEEPPPLSQHTRILPPELDRIEKKVLAKAREERYQIASELQRDLKRLKEKIELETRLDSAVPAIKTRTRKVAAGLVAIAAISALYFAFHTRPTGAPDRRRLTFGNGPVLSARFMPNSQEIVYSAAFDGQPIELFTSNLAQDPLLPSSHHMQGAIQSISTNGMMAVLLDCQMSWGTCYGGNLVTVPIGGGTPRPIMSNVSAADWSAKNETMLVARVEDGEYKVVEHPAGRVLYTSSGSISTVRISPDDKKVALMDHPTSDASGQVVIVDRGTLKTTKSEIWKTAFNAVWSSTGEEVWFSAGRDRKLDIHAIAVSGKERPVFLESPSDLRLEDISSDGRVLATSGDPGARMFEITRTSAQARPLPAFDWSTATDLSANGKTLLFFDWGFRSHGNETAYRQLLDGKSTPVPLGPGKALALSPNGKWALALQTKSSQQLVLLATESSEQKTLPRGEIREYRHASFIDDDQILIVDTEGGLPRSHVQRIDGGEPTPLAEEGTEALFFSHDGRRFVAWRPDDNYYIYSYPMADDAERKLIPLQPREVPIQWSKDGLALYVRGSAKPSDAFGDFAARVFKVSLSDNKRIPWMDIMPDPIGNIGIEAGHRGILITPDGESCVYTYWFAIQTLWQVSGLK